MIPYAVDASFDRRPVVHWLIFAGIISLFFLQVITSEEQITERPIVQDGLDNLRLAKKQVAEEEPVTGPMSRFALDGWGIIGLFGHSWLHANVIHLICNLIFLWPFGSAVCSKIGNKAYLAVYLGLGLLGGVVHVLFDGEPAFGASVAINGIVGMYIVLFPENSISCFFILPRPVALSISGYWIILLWFVVDILAAMFGVQGVTYFAHVVGFGAGLGLAVLALKKKWLVMERDEKSLLQMLGRRKKEPEQQEKEQEHKDSEAIEKRAQTPDIEKAAPEPAAMEPEKYKDEFIRFSCQCGKKIKVPRGHAGETGRCPRCKRWMKVPER